jgi:tripartite ATP-independent transporter DctM subunit
MTPYVGLFLLIFVGFAVVTTGIPAAVILISMTSLGVVLGLVTGAGSTDMLTALSFRLINLLENDLLQALPLYVLMGTLINRLPIAEALYRASLAALPRKPSAPLVSGFALGALLGPMNGSVGASVLALSRVVEPRLADIGIPPATRAAVIAVASTLGVVIPPSLVLILLGDAMLSAHTIAVTVTGRHDRVINSQDVFHGALAPAGLYLAVSIALAWWIGRRVATKEKTDKEPAVSLNQLILSVSVLILILMLLGGVASGYFYAVEAAAMGAFALLVAGFVTGRLHGPALRIVLRDAVATTGALFFLLVAATTFTLVLQFLGTANLVGAWIVAIPGGDLTVVAVVLGALWLSALVLDAFEIIFVVVPIVIPPLLIRVADARWISVLVLLTVQTSFLDPFIGYAIMMVRGVMKEKFEFGALLRALWPFLVAQWMLLITVLLFPGLTHIGQDKADRSRDPTSFISDQEIDRRLHNMVPLPPDLPAQNMEPSK